MKYADHCPNDDGNIREIKHRPKLEIDEIDNTTTPQMIAEVTAGTAKRCAKGHWRHSPLKERPALNYSDENADLCNPKYPQSRAAPEDAAVGLFVQHPADRHHAEGHSSSLSKPGNDQHFHRLVKYDQ
jgi:hypothetical protein